MMGGWVRGEKKGKTEEGKGGGAAGAAAAGAAGAAGGAAAAGETGVASASAADPDFNPDFSPDPFPAAVSVVLKTFGEFFLLGHCNAAFLTHGSLFGKSAVRRTCSTITITITTNSANT
jgi:hypothetical protein